MSIEQMREDLLQEYPGERWRQRVLSMPGYEVLKKYTSIQERKAKRRFRIEDPETGLPKAPFGEQLSLLNNGSVLLFKP